MGQPQTVLVTGCAGFIGMHLSSGLLRSGFRVIGLDNLNEYYDPCLKLSRLEQLGFKQRNFVKGELNWTESEGFGFVQADVKNEELVARILAQHGVSLVFHLAAQAGVRYSIEKPQDYMDANVVGTTALLQACRQHRVDHVYLASSSSVYGALTDIPFREDMNCNVPLSIYAASKAATELIAHAYSQLFQMNVTALRFFTVYGAWDRPDMALHKFVDCISKGKEIEVFNHGEMERDFTYVEDLVEMVLKLVRSSNADRESGFEVFNVGSGNPISLKDYIHGIELAIGKKALKRNMPMQPGDLKRTYADVTKLSHVIGELPKTALMDGMGKAVEWNLAYYDLHTR